MTILDGRCPMWREDSLCRIQAELGEAALCKTCREFPRLTHDYGDFIERGLELSCPEAARILLTAPAAPMVTEDVPGGEDAEYDTEAMAVLKRTRQTMLAFLADKSHPVGETLALSLLYGYQAQSELDGGEEAPFDVAAAWEQIRSFAKPDDPSQILAFFRQLEILTPQWKTRLEAAPVSGWPEGTRNLARYFVERYWLQAVSDYDLTGRVKFMLISCLVIACLGGDFISTAQLYSKEIENNWENVEAILDAAYTNPAFTDNKLLGMLLSQRNS